MSDDEKAFFDTFDATPGDSTALLAFADWLSERDPPDPRAAAYRVIGALGRWPDNDGWRSGAFGWSHSEFDLWESHYRRIRSGSIPTEWWDKWYDLINDHIYQIPQRTAIDALARSFELLSGDTKEKLLALAGLAMTAAT